MKSLKVDHLPKSYLEYLLQNKLQLKIKSNTIDNLGYAALLFGITGNLIAHLVY